MAQTMTRSAQDDSQNVGNLQEVERTNSTFGTFGRYTEIPLDEMTPEQKTVMTLKSKSAAKCRAHTRSGSKILSF
jgi:hypothetical protein